MNCQEYREIVAAHVDGVLTPLEREGAEGHVVSCVACRKVYEQERAFRAFMAAKPLLQKVPPVLEQKLRSALAQAETESWWSRLQKTFTFPRLAVGLVAAGLLALLFFPQLLREKGNEGLLQEVAQDYLVATSPSFSLAFRTDDPQALQVYFNQSGSLDFKAQVLDFRGQGYRLKGGTILKRGKRVIAATLYEGPEGYILCHRFKGTVSLLAAGGEKVGNHWIYTHENLTLCLTQEEGTMCCLVARLPKETFVRDLEAVFSQTS